MSRAAEILEARQPGFVFDGEVQADVATDPRLQESEFPFCRLGGRANVLVCPSLESANISYKLLNSIGAASCLGPILVGPKKPANILERGATLQEIENIVYITAAQAFRHEIVEALKGLR